MTFQQNLATLPSVDHLSGLDIFNAQGELVRHIPAVAGKLGSLRVFYALAQRFQQLDAQAAQLGLALFAEHVVDAKQHPGKHPNIDFLFQVIDTESVLSVMPLSK
ncbi:DUF2322 family protein [Testudinibacter sp. TR-2022]|uniref:DUF2322 family protein n=1 Tax=Testudinibacter sp. TR-2022 TaxID=2585029 RepID=UPI00111A8403|nr:DUF2322 family protein [Testudinibacter sp. TR-2022]TNH03743.1 DUF2322 family protein [Pasteurellaceae bacterium Phil31]TNH11686.1 DUF2322 family protein [Testudinibacter sp. TR-2022]TNH12056.1 DUF2322 family protein [Testudinibacter sp. TR-2022]TNH15523.1 DUF2322 family protein [Testudinibacter sp. TR-2022]TNH15643.1 DUF2322 family protein [Testudinibacter sp. TR-2022]